MSRRRPKQEEAPIGEANVLPVMNIMFLLIPALLLAMEAASMAGIAITPPRTAPTPSRPSDPPKPPSLELSVFILGDGFRVSSAAQQHGAEAGRAQVSGAPTIPLAKPNTPLSNYDRYDYAGLEALAREFKVAFPDETIVTISAENDIPAQVLISTLDALRGTDCKLGQLAYDDPLPAECLFINPIVSAGGG
jgi:hypothetical protein